MHQPSSDYGAMTTYGLPRMAWTEEEDELLRAAVAQHGVKRWAQISALLPGRTSKACSHRYRTYLQPGVTHTSMVPFTEFEVAVVKEAHRMLGNNWSVIARMLPGRTNAAVKNFWRRALKGRSERGTAGRQSTGNGAAPAAAAAGGPGAVAVNSHHNTDAAAGTSAASGNIAAAGCAAAAATATAAAAAGIAPTSHSQCAADVASSSAAAAAAAASIGDVWLDSDDVMSGDDFGDDVIFESESEDEGLGGCDEEDSQRAAPAAAGTARPRSSNGPVGYPSVHLAAGGTPSGQQQRQMLWWQQHQPDLTVAGGNTGAAGATQAASVWDCQAGTGAYQWDNWRSTTQQQPQPVPAALAAAAAAAGPHVSMGHPTPAASSSHLLATTGQGAAAAAAGSEGAAADGVGCCAAQDRHVAHGGLLWPARVSSSCLVETKGPGGRASASHVGMATLVSDGDCTTLPPPELNMANISLRCITTGAHSAGAAASAAAAAAAAAATEQEPDCSAAPHHPMAAPGYGLHPLQAQVQAGLVGPCQHQMQNQQYEQQQYQQGLPVPWQHYEQQLWLSGASMVPDWQGGVDRFARPSLCSDAGTGPLPMPEGPRGVFGMPEPSAEASMVNAAVFRPAVAQACPAVPVAASVRHTAASGQLASPPTAREGSLQPGGVCAPQITCSSITRHGLPHPVDTIWEQQQPQQRAKKRRV